VSKPGRQDGPNDGGKPGLAIAWPTSSGIGSVKATALESNELDDFRAKTNFPRLSVTQVAANARGISQLLFQQVDAFVGSLPGRVACGGTNRPGDREIPNERDDFRVGFPQQS
jgi:hypothetical protein